MVMMLAGCGYHASLVRKVPAYKMQRIERMSMPQDIKPITILVHGTRLPPPLLVAAPALFFGVTTPSGLHKVSDVNPLYYFSYMAKGIYNVAPDEFPLENFYLYGWSGKLDSIEREIAGTLLYHYIKRIRTDNRFAQTPITVITISHGASVVLNMAAVAEKNNDTTLLVDRLVLLCGPVMDNTHDYVYSPVFKSVFNIFSAGDSIQVGDPQQLENLKEEKKTFFSRRTFDKQVPNLVQAEVAFKNHTLGHIDFCFPAFYEKLPALLKVLSSQTSTLESSDGVYKIDLTKLA